MFGYLNLEIGYYLIRWTREELPEEGMGLAFFRNAVQYIRKHLL
jgi:hypothetical protein